MSVLTSPPSQSRSWVLPVSVLSVVLGMLIALSLQTQKRLKAEGIISPRDRVIQALKKTNQDNLQEIAKLREMLSKYEKLLVQETSSPRERNKISAIHERLKEVELFAGLLPVEGPGIVVTLRDSPRAYELAKEFARQQGNLDYQSVLGNFMVHDFDVVGVVNELKQAGAEAIAINGQRVVATTAIRCAGNTVYINGKPLGGTAPYRIEAIGYPEDLEHALMMPGGFLDTQQLRENDMVLIERKNRIVIPAYDGPISIFKFAKPVPLEKAQRKL